MIEQKNLPKIHLKLTNREDFIELMRGEYLRIDDDHFKIAIWYELYDFRNKKYRDSVKQLLENKELFLVCKKTKDFCSTYTMYRKFFQIKLDEDFSGYAVYNLKGKRLNYNKSLYVCPVIAPQRTIADIKQLYKKKK